MDMDMGAEVDVIPRVAVIPVPSYAPQLTFPFPINRSLLPDSILVATAHIELSTMAPPSDFIDYPTPAEGPVAQYGSPPLNNPTLRGWPLTIASNM
jgi:hypothetical protein